MKKLIFLIALALFGCDDTKHVPSAHVFIKSEIVTAYVYNCYHSQKNISTWVTIQYDRYPQFDIETRLSCDYLDKFQGLTTPVTIKRSLYQINSQRLEWEYDADSIKEQKETPVHD